MKNKLDIERVNACAKDAFELLLYSPLDGDAVWDALELFYTPAEIIAASHIILHYVMDKA